MTAVDEHAIMAEQAQEGNAHVAVLTYYRDALDRAGYSSNAASILLAAMQYTQKLKKGDDRKAIAGWGLASLERMKPTSLEAAIILEIEKLNPAGGQIAASS